MLLELFKLIGKSAEPACMSSQQGAAEGHAKLAPLGLIPCFAPGKSSTRSRVIVSLVEADLVLSADPNEHVLVSGRPEKRHKMHHIMLAGTFLECGGVQAGVDPVVTLSHLSWPPLY